VTRIRLFRLPARLRPARRLRLLAAAAAPLALAAVAVPAAAASNHARPAAARSIGTRAVAATTASSGGQALAPLSLPGLNARTATVTLITGDRVRLTAAGDGRYNATALPGPGSSPEVSISAQATPHGVTSLRAIPAAAQPLLSTGQADPGLFDLLWLATHGDTGPAARIPVTIEYADSAGMRQAAASLPGVTVQAAKPAADEVMVTVAAARAAGFWAALTGHPTSAAGPSTWQPGARESLAGGAIRIWLTGNQAPPQATRSPQDGQSLYTVTETITRMTGIPEECVGSDFGYLGCGFSLGGPSLFGVAGTGQDQSYSPSGLPSCVSETASVCTAWQATFTVPAGVYYAHGYGNFLTTDDSDHTLEQAVVELDIPQFTVTGNTAISLDVDKAVPVTVSTPQPAANVGGGSMLAVRMLPDGDSTAEVEENIAYGFGDLWAVPTPPADRATIGGYHLETQIVMGRPQVTAAVTSPGHQILHPLYPCDSDATQDSSCNVTRFSGRQALQLVNAGYGTAADFSKIDARGKLALIRNCPPNTGCPDNVDNVAEMQVYQLASAKAAGAAGVLFDAATDIYGYPNLLPAFVCCTGQGATPDIPFTEIDNAEGNGLLRLLAKGPVTITIDDPGQSPYAYNLAFRQEAQIQASLHYTLTSGQLAEVTDSYHSDTGPALMTTNSTTFWPDDFFEGGSVNGFTSPWVFHDYYGPLTSDAVWSLSWSGPESNLYSVFGQSGERGTLGWNEPPDTPGVWGPYPDANQAQPNRRLTWCVGCRQGDTFYPAFFLVNGSNPSTPAEDAGYVGTVHLYDQAGQEIPPSTIGSLAYYPGLPAGQQRYKLVSELPGQVTTWDFTSGEPATDQTPDGTVCLGLVIGTSTAPCQADPLVFLRYNAYPSLDNTLAAPGFHTLQVTGYHQDPSAAPVTSLQLWLSTDGGTTWQQARVSGGRNGTWTVGYTLPQLSQTNGYLSIKATATDSAGNDTTQTIVDAVNLAAPISGPAVPHGR
jgi:hypothetical protein